MRCTSERPPLLFQLCSAGDLIELKDPVRVVTCLQRVLELASPVTSPH